ncbi:glyoxalase [marine bacterium AO1-C]|nr:glyoxalase [marine bacterium AO1-C]
MIGKKIKGLGEVVIRVQNMALVADFYQNIIGLELIQQRGKYTFFKIAEGHAGHDQMLALFDVSIPTAFGETKAEILAHHTSLHHIALEIDKEDYNATLYKLEQAGVEVKTEVFEWVQWKSIFIKDPEMNIIEFVCFDDTIQAT